MKQKGSVFLAMIAGLVVAQILATVQVYLADTTLYRTMITVREAGFFTVPNRIVLSTLDRFGPAFWGGLFFTLSVGLGVTLCTVVMAWAWKHLFRGSRLVGFLVLLPLVFCFLGVNAAGFNLLDSLYFLLIPMTVLLVMQRAKESLSKVAVLTRIIVAIAPVVLLGVLLQTGLDTRPFVAIRDNLLLTNPIGARLNDFYYTYTLYPAETFKTLDQKLIKTYRFEAGVEGPARAQLADLLLDHDYLPVSPAGGPDLTLDVDGVAVQKREQSGAPGRDGEFCQAARGAAQGVLPAHGPASLFPPVCLCVNGFGALAFSLSSGIWSVPFVVADRLCRPVPGFGRRPRCRYPGRGPARVRPLWRQPGRTP
jgi:hypothetical protein